MRYILREVKYNLKLYKEENVNLEEWFEDAYCLDKWDHKMIVWITRMWVKLFG